LRLYIFLVSATQGNIILKDKDLVTITLYLGRCDKTVKSYLKKLVKNNWIGYDRERNKYWIRGFDSIRRQLKLIDRAAVEYGPEYLDDFDAFTYAAIIGREIKRQVWRRRLAAISRDAFQDLPSKPGYYPLANILIIKKLNISMSTASRYKKKAKEAGFLDSIPTIRQTTIKKDELGTCRSNDKESYGKMFSRGQRVVEPGPNLLRVYLTYRGRKKIET